MTFSDWVYESRCKVEAYGLLPGIRASAFDFWGGALRRLCHATGLDDAGTPIFERDWDVLVLLDTCRVDVLREVSDEYDFLPEEVPSFRSLGSTSWEWMADNFTPEYAAEMAETAYVTANAHTKRFGDEFDVTAEDFLLLDEVWEYAWDEDLGGIPPRPVTDRAVATKRELDPERLIVHYMQPHTPYRSMDVERERDAEFKKSVWDLLEMGDLSREEAWRAYRDNLRWVLGEVDLLLENLDAETVVISSDHGEAFGEWGLYGHYRHVPAPELKTVPWVTTSATDEGAYEPDVSVEDVELTNEDIEQRLSALGYR